MRFAELDETLTTIVRYPLTLEDLKRDLPERGWPSDPTPDTLGGTRYVIIADAPRPTLAFGESAQEMAPINDAGTWRQAWTTTRITLGQAKQKLGQMVIEIYWNRMLAPPQIAEFQNAGMSFIATIQGRQGRWDDDLADVAARIQGATTIDQAYAIYLELQALT